MLRVIDSGHLGVILLRTNVRRLPMRIPHIDQEVKRIVGFNTERLYTANGQEITVAELDDGTILFNDHSRMVTGRLRNHHTRPEWMDLETFAHQEYLHMRYDYDARANVIRAESFPKKRM
jgi:hypothetical protein